MHVFLAAFILLATIAPASFVVAQTKLKTRRTPSRKMLTEEKWKQLDESVERGIAWLATQQRADGSFNSIKYAQPAVTSFCLLAFLAQGESPSGGEYQKTLTDSISFIVDQQKPNGLLSTTAPSKTPIPRNVDFKSLGLASVYNHAISALALAEAYGQSTPEQAKKMKPAIEKAVQATLEMQRWNKREVNQGGWRYLTPRPSGDSDLSITGWQLMFLRSAKNAGFDVPKESIDIAVGYVKRCFLQDKDRKVFGYLVGNKTRLTRAMAGAGMLALAHAGRHGSEESIASGELILKTNFAQYNNGRTLRLFKNSTQPDRYHYGLFLCTQAMYQSGGKFWRQFFPPVVDVLLANQQRNGAWPPEQIDPTMGSCYPTALCILSLSTPNQMLPIFQR